MKKQRLNTALFIAWRYLFSKKKHNIINIISLISALGIMVCTAAFVIILSVMNGLEGLVQQSFNSFNPDFKITLVEGKSFEVDSFPLAELSNIKGVKAVEEIVSDMALVTYEEKQMLINLKGVSHSYIQNRGIDQLLVDGQFVLKDRSLPFGVIGGGAASVLQVNLNNIEPLQVYYPKRTKKSLMNAADAFQKQLLILSGVFVSNTEYDNQYIFCDLEFIRTLMSYEQEVTSVEIILDKKANIEKCRQEIEKIIGDGFLLQDKYQQEETLFKAVESERLIIYFIFAFILLVAFFNMIGTLGMLIIEKREDVKILRSLGATTSFSGKIFVLEGLFISFLGGVIGMCLGALICFIQSQFHLIALGNGGGIIDYYPVIMMFWDFVVVFITTLVISLLTSWIPVSVILKRRK